MKTWLVKLHDNSVFRHNEYEDEPLWLGNIDELQGERWFTMYGDNRTLNKDELKQLLDFLG